MSIARMFGGGRYTMLAGHETPSLRQRNKPIPQHDHHSNAKTVARSILAHDLCSGMSGYAPSEIVSRTADARAEALPGPLTLITSHPLLHNDTQLARTLHSGVSVRTISERASTIRSRGEDVEVFNRAQQWCDAFGLPAAVILHPMPGINGCQLFARFDDAGLGRVTVGFVNARWSKEEAPCKYIFHDTGKRFSIAVALLNAFGVNAPESILPEAGAKAVKLVRHGDHVCHDYNTAAVDDDVSGDETVYRTLCKSCNNSAQHFMVKPDTPFISVSNLGGIAKCSSIIKHRRYAPWESAEAWVAHLGVPIKLLFHAPPGVNGCQLFARFADCTFGSVCIEFKAARWNDSALVEATSLVDADEHFVQLLALMHAFDVRLPLSMLPVRHAPPLVLVRVLLESLPATHTKAIPRWDDNPFRFLICKDPDESRTECLAAY